MRTNHAAVVRALGTMRCHEWHIDELNVRVDHVYLLVQLPPKEAVAHAVQLVKGGTGKAIRSEFPELEEFLWGDNL